MKTTTLILLLALAGCSCSPDLKRPPSTGAPGDTTYLIDLDPTAVTPTELEQAAIKASDALFERGQLQGVVWPLMRRGPDEDPTLRYKGADSALFSGFALASYCFQWAATGDAQARERARVFLRGIYYLTHVAGRGVIARCAFPLSKKAEFDYPENRTWARRLHEGFMGVSKSFPAPWGDPFPKSVYYTRATKDQLTGILFGLAAAWRTLLDQESRNVVALIMHDLREHLKEHGWKIQDALGGNDTNANSVDGNLRLQFAALYRHTVRLTRPRRVGGALEDYMARLGGNVGDLFNVFNNYTQYYAHSLRSARTFTVWLLEPVEEFRREVGRHHDRNTWAHVSAHQNAFIAGCHAAMTGDRGAAKVRDRALASLSLKPTRGWGSPYGGQVYGPLPGDHLAGCAARWVVAPHLRKQTSYWTWQKEPWDVGTKDPNGLAEGPWLDLTLPYWLGRVEGL